MNGSAYSVSRGSERCVCERENLWIIPILMLSHKLVPVWNGEWFRNSWQQLIKIVTYSTYFVPLIYYLSQGSCFSSIIVLFLYINTKFTTSQDWWVFASCALSCVQVMFETYQFAGVYIAIQAVLTLYAQGNYFLNTFCWFEWNVIIAIVARFSWMIICIKFHECALHVESFSKCV